MSVSAIDTESRGRRSDISDEEWEARVELAACYRLIQRLGMDDLIYTHISARVPGPEHHFLINPFGLLYDEVTASNLVKVDLDGKIIGDSDYGINPAGFVIHSCVHRDLPHIGCVLHTHTVAGCAVSAQEDGLLPLTQTAMIFHGQVAYHEYEGPALDFDEQQRLVADLGDKPVMILRNHGLLTAGRTVPEAFIAMYYMEQACRMQVAAMAGGAAKLHMPPKGVPEHTAELIKFGGEFNSRPGSREFAALVRRMDREDTSYRM